MSLEQRTQALLDVVENDRRDQCGVILAQARQQAEAALAQARLDARQRVREAFAEERERAHARVAAARAEWQTRRRLHEQQRAAAWLDVAWQRLPQALRARWADAAARRQWVDGALGEARGALAPGEWRIDHAPGWPAAERQALASHLEADAGTSVSFTEHAGLGAGLRFVADHNVVDATLDGLLADRETIGAHLLGELGGAT